jgi:hypothetical protein
MDDATIPDRDTIEAWQQKIVQPKAYERRLVAYYDVLGWRKKIEQAGDDPTELQILRTIVGMFGLLSKTLTKGNAETRMSTFSDNVVVSEPYDQDQRSLLVFLMRLGFVQLSAASSGFLIRGAVTIGQIMHDEEMVFGPALNRAYELERSLAVYPRIVLDPDIIPDIEAFPPFVTAEDGVHFIDAFTPECLEVQRRAKIAQGVADEKAVLTAPNIILSLRRELSMPLSDKERAKVEWVYNRLVKSVLDTASPYRTTPRPLRE